MRPQHLAADNADLKVGEQYIFSFASMRPQHLAADNQRGRTQSGRRALVASMRPQHLAADNSRAGLFFYAILIGFNEAAAFSCG